MCITGVLTALVFVFTAYLHIPSVNGYVHIGDGFIYFAACLLPLPYGLFVGAGGAVLADCLTGYAVWAPGSAVIKALLVLCFCRKDNKILSGRNWIALLPAAMICVSGYYLYGSIIAGNFFAPLADAILCLIEYNRLFGLEYLVRHFHFGNAVLRTDFSSDCSL